jgi:hypothetical protein
MKFNQIFNTYKARFITYFTFLVGCCLISGLLFFRFQVRDISLNVRDLSFLLPICFCVTQGFIVSSLDKQRCYKKATTSIFSRLSEFISGSLLLVYTMIFEWLPPKFILPIYHVVNFLHKYTKEQLRVRLAILCVLFEILPRFVIVGCLAYELFSKSKLHYFYLSFSLLIIPLLFGFFMFIIEDIGPRLHAEYDTYLIAKKVPINLTEEQKALVPPEYRDRPSFKLEIEFKPEYAGFREIGEFLETMYHPMAYLYPHLQLALDFRKKLKLYGFLYYHLLSIVLWINILIVIVLQPVY